eukprot:9478414-Pyramimonas_sp.AAC.2
MRHNIPATLGTCLPASSHLGVSSSRKCPVCSSVCSSLALVYRTRLRGLEGSSRRGLKYTSIVSNTPAAVTVTPH